MTTTEQTPPTKEPPKTSGEMLRESVSNLARAPEGMWTGKNCHECGKEIDENYEPCDCGKVDDCTDCEDQAYGDVEVCTCKEPDEGEVYDINYTIDKSGELRGVELMLAGGGPNIWLRARVGLYATIYGAWGSDSEEYSTDYRGDDIVDYYGEYVYGVEVKR